MCHLVIDQRSPKQQFHEKPEQVRRQPNIIIITDIRLELDYDNHKSLINRER